MAEISLDADLVVKQWSPKFFAYGMQKMYFGPFIGSAQRGDLAFIPKKERQVKVLSSENAIIQVQMDLTKKPGDTVTFPLIAPLTGMGRVNGTLEGNEEAFDNYDWSVSIADWGNAIRDAGALQRQQVAWSMDTVRKAELALWYAYALDKATYRAMAGLVVEGDGGTDLLAASVNSRRVIGGTEAAGALELFDTDVELQADDYMSLDLIAYISRFAKASEPVVRPIIIDGEELYCLFMHPQQVRALRDSTDWKNVQYYANVRGEKNPYFRKALGRYLDVLLFEYPRVETRTGDGGAVSLTTNTFDGTDAFTSGVKCARALFCGAQAAVHAYAQGPTFTTKKFDYGNKHGTALRMLMGVGRPEFNSVDYGVIAVDTAIQTDTVS